MIAAIPAEDRPTVIEQRVPEHLTPPRPDLAEAVNAVRIEVVHQFQNVLPRRFSVLARAIRNGAPLTCLSCGAKTLADGSLPCGH